MNDNELENLLAALRPAALPPPLRARLEAPAPVKRRPVPWRWTVATLAPLAAAACWWLMTPPTVHESSPRPPTIEQIAGGGGLRTLEETSRVVKVQDLPMLNPGSLNPIGVRLVQWVDDTTYVGENPRVIFRKQQPRLQLVAVSFQTY